MSTQRPAAEKLEIAIDLLQEADLDEADLIFRLAFGTFIGFPDPANFHRGYNYVRSRWNANPPAFFGAKVDGKLIGSNFGSNWGSVGFFGPLTIHPDFWDHGVGKRLMEPIIERFSAWNTKHAGLYTFPQSAKHLGLYQRFGFWPRHLIAVMSRSVTSDEQQSITLFSELSSEQRAEALQAVKELTDEIYAGLDVSIEIESIQRQKLGDTLLIWEDSKLLALAACHCGVDTEAGADNCYVKFGAVRPGVETGRLLQRLLDGVAALASRHDLKQVVAGVNTARIEAYQEMLALGFRTLLQGIAMHRADDAGYSRPGVFVLDDWR